MALTLKQIKEKMSPEVIAAINKYFPEGERDMAIAVAWEESKGVANAVGVNDGSKDLGVFQINDYYHPEVKGIDPYNVDANVKMASEIQSTVKRGWKEWNTHDKAMAYFPNTVQGSPVENKDVADEEERSLFSDVQKDFKESKLGSFNQETFNFGIKPPETSFNAKKPSLINKKPPVVNNKVSGITEENEYLKSIQKNKNIGTGIEVGKLGANLASYMRNQRTKAPTPLKSKNIPLLDKSFMNADYSQINQDVVRMLGATREAGGDQGNINQLLRGSTDAKTKLGATVNQFNLAEKGRVDAANIGIMEKNIGNKLNTDVYNRNVNLKLAEQKGLADTALMQGMFDNVTNMAAYRAKAATETEANKRYLKEFQQENDRIFKMT